MNTSKSKWNAIGIFLVGFLWGAALIFIGGVLYLRHALIEERVSDQNFDQITMRIPGIAGQFSNWTVQDAGCTLPMSGDGSRMRAYRLCNSAYAAEMISGESDRRISAVLPCTFSVYEKKDGKTYLSRLNVSLLGRLLGGAPARVLPDEVNPDQELMLQTIGFR